MFLWPLKVKKGLRSEIMQSWAAWACPRDNQNKPPATTYTSGRVSKDITIWVEHKLSIPKDTDFYRRPVKKSPSLRGQKSTHFHTYSFHRNINSWKLECGNYSRAETNKGRKLLIIKGQKKSKWFVQADVFSKKRTNKFYFVLVRFLEEIVDTKKTLHFTS